MLRISAIQIRFILQCLFYRREIIGDPLGLTCLIQIQYFLLLFFSILSSVSHKLFRYRFSNKNPDQKYHSRDGASSVSTELLTFCFPFPFPFGLAVGQCSPQYCSLWFASRWWVSCVFILKIILQPFTFQLSTQQAVAGQHELGRSSQGWSQRLPAATRPLEVIISPVPESITAIR